jgi:hypothetical protein
MFLSAARRKNPWEIEAISQAHSFTWVFQAFPHVPVPWQLLDNVTHIELTISHGELIVSDSELTFSHTPSIFYNIYIYH